MSVVIKIIESVVGLGMLVALYSMFAPFMNLMRDTFLLLGAPAANSYWISQMFYWCFVIIAVFLIILPLMSAYREIQDQGRQTYSSYQRY